MEDKKPTVLYYVVLISIAMVLVAIFGEIKNHALEQKQEYDLKPTAGIVTYMSSLQHHAQEYEPSTSELNILESNIQTVAAYEEEQERLEQEAIEIEQAERAREEALINCFGYIPSDAEITLWEDVVMAESGNQPERVIRAVADAIANRCRSESFPNTISGVVYQSGQFQPIGDGTLGRYKTTDLVKEICSDAICEGLEYPYLYFRTNRYHTGRTPGEQIGAHYFSY